MFELLYVFIITQLFFSASSDSTVAFGNKHLNILNGMRLPSAPESILCDIVVHAFDLCLILTWYNYTDCNGIEIYVFYS